jgi:hypothetical protein
MWKGLLAEQLGKQIARSGGIGIAAAVLKAHPGAGKGGPLAGNTPQGLLPLSPLRTSLARHDVGAQMAALSQPVAGLAAGATTSKRTP